MVMRVPILTPGLEIPKSVHVLEESLPDYLKKSVVATKEELEDIDGVSTVVVDQKIAESNSVLINQVRDMITGVAGRSGFLFRQVEPVTTATIKHDFDRDGPVSVVVYDIDYTFIWEFYEVHRIDRNTVQLAFDDPTAFNALVL